MVQLLAINGPKISEYKLVVIQPLVFLTKGGKVFYFL